MAMPSFPYPDTEYAHNLAEVPRDLLNLQDLDYWSFVEGNSPRNVIPRSPLKPQLADQQGHVPILPKAEPDFLPDYLESLPTSWYCQDQASFVSMAANFQPTPSSNQQLQLQISEPPTPAAECQVTSTNLSPLPINSPYSPHSDVSYDTGEFDSSLMDGSDIGLSLADLDEINLKGLTEEQLVSFTARDLNRICRDMPEDVIKQLKKRRRTLKNRGYAYNSRIRRVTQKNGLEVERDDLQKQLLQLTERCKALEQEAEEWKKKAQALESRNFL